MARILERRKRRY